MFLKNCHTDPVMGVKNVMKHVDDYIPRPRLRPGIYFTPATLLKAVGVCFEVIIFD